MRLMTWNVNGLRSLKTPLKQLLDSLECEIICFQETKLTREYLDEHLAVVDGYNSYFSFSKVKAGYSGVATFVKNECTPWLAEEGLSNIGKKDAEYGSCVGCYGDIDGRDDEELERLDGEGRSVMTEHEVINASGETQRLVVINVYCPRADPDNEERLNFKLNFYKLLRVRAEEILGSGKSVIIVGDINTSHKVIDHCDPGEELEFQSNCCRQWMNSFILDVPLMDNINNTSTINTNDIIEYNRYETTDEDKNSKNFVDVLRIFHPKTCDLFTNWCSSTGARTTNYGTRIDYIFADKKLALEDKMFVGCCTRPDITGSDHCPVIAELCCVGLAAFRCPPLCSKYLFQGRQQKLSKFFPNKNVSSVADDTKEDKICEERFHLDGNKRVERVAGKRMMHTQQTPKSKKSKSSTKPQDPCSILKYFSGNKDSQSKESVNDIDIKSSQESTENFSDFSQSSTNSNLTISSSQESNDSHQRNIWNNILKGPPKAPLCKGHEEPCLMRVVKKLGPNKGRRFWVCNRPEGHRSNHEAQCAYFMWIDK